jgi:hypothetical protein
MRAPRAWISPGGARRAERIRTLRMNDRHQRLDGDGAIRVRQQPMRGKMLDQSGFVSPPGQRKMRGHGNLLSAALQLSQIIAKNPISGNEIFKNKSKRLKFILTD